MGKIASIETHARSAAPSPFPKIARFNQSWTIRRCAKVVLILGLIFRGGQPFWVAVIMWRRHRILAEPTGVLRANRSSPAGVVSLPAHGFLACNDGTGWKDTTRENISRIKANMAELLGL
jgi:hypothetical protein